MSQLSYLQQIAQRASDHLPVLMPPRSTFTRFDSPVPMEILDEFLQSESRVLAEERPSMLSSLNTVQTEAQKESVANPLIQLPNTTLEPSPAIVSLTSPELPNPTQVAFETISDVEMSSLFVQGIPEIAPQALQPRTEGLPDRTPYVIASQNLSQPKPSTLTPAIMELSNLSQAEHFKESFMPTESTATNDHGSLHWLTPIIQNRNQDRNIEMPLLEPQLREIYSEVADSPIALETQELATQEHSPKGNTIHIGEIDIQIVPATVAPNAIAPPPAKSGSTNRLARNFSGSFGLRQG